MKTLADTISTPSDAIAELKILAEELGEDFEGVCHDPGERLQACLKAIASTPVVRVGTAIMVRDQRGFLLLGRRKSAHGRGTWSFPGGAIDFGESPLEAAQRELREETGLEIKNLRVHHRIPFVNTRFPNGSQWVTLYFIGELGEGHPEVKEPEKCERWDWFDPDALPEPLFEPLSEGPLIEELRAPVRVKSLDPDYIPAVGDDVYIGSRMYISRGSDDIVGGLARIKTVKPCRNGGRDDYQLSFEEVHTGLYWNHLATQQEKLQAEFGNRRAYRDPDDDPSANTGGL